MSWICDECKGINVNLCKYCPGCANRGKARARPKPLIEYEYDDWDEIVQERELWKINRKIGIDEIWIRECIQGKEKMTPQEELFAKLFNGTKVEVKDMDALMLRAYREELSAIAFEARAKLAAVDDEINSRKPKKSDKGFQTSLGEDDNSKQAINRINERQKKLTKNEKILAGLKTMGLDAKTAESIMSAGAILQRVKNTKPEDIREIKEETKTPVFNPFEKK